MGPHCITKSSRRATSKTIWISASWIEKTSDEVFIWINVDSILMLKLSRNRSKKNKKRKEIKCMRIRLWGKFKKLKWWKDRERKIPKIEEKKCKIRINTFSRILWTRRHDHNHIADPTTPWTSGIGLNKKDEERLKKPKKGC